jgi:hypothetical protein
MLPGDDIYDQVNRGIRLWDKVLLCCSKNSLTSWWVDDEIGKAFAKEQALMKERETKVLALIPLDLDGYLFSGWKSGKASQVRERLAPNFRGWETSHSKCEEQINNVIRALAFGWARKRAPAKAKTVRPYCFVSTRPAQGLSPFSNASRCLAKGKFCDTSLPAEKTRPCTSQKSVTQGSRSHQTLSPKRRRD